MNEYQDQDKWFAVEVNKGRGWAPAGTADTEQDAQVLMSAYAEGEPQYAYRVRAHYGLEG